MNPRFVGFGAARKIFRKGGYGRKAEVNGWLKYEGSGNIHRYFRLNIAFFKHKNL
jgi:hypothetical protein